MQHCLVEGKELIQGDVFVSSDSAEASVTLVVLMHFRTRFKWHVLQLTVPRPFSFSFVCGVFSEILCCVFCSTFFLCGEVVFIECGSSSTQLILNYISTCVFIHLKTTFLFLSI